MRSVAALPQTLTASRPARRVAQIAALVLTATVLATTLLSSSAAAATHAGAESAFVTRMNAERRAAGLGRLAIDVQLTRVARAWTSTMASRDELSHNPRLALDVKGDWRRVGENVGYSRRAGTTEAALVSGLHEAFMASPGHRANILRDYNQVGVGVMVADNGTMWVTVVFAKASLPSGRREIGQALRSSRATYPSAGMRDATAGHVTLAAAPASYGRVDGHRASGPVLLTPAPSPIDPAPVLHPAVRAEIDRVLGGRGTVFLVGDADQVSARAARELAQDGYTVQRVAA
jgi:uncharacterized protein YkwD